MELFIVIAVYIAFGFLINEMSKTRNRNQVAWVVLSLLLSPLLGAIALLIVGKAKEETVEQ